MKTGWARIYRQIEDNPLWLSEKFTRGQAWIDLVIFANHKANFFYVRGNKVSVNRGQIAWSEVTMSKRWQWSRNKVRGFLKMLENEQQIKQQKNSVTSIITILNYDKYQSEKTADRTTERQQKDSRRNTNKNVKNDKNVKNIYASLKCLTDELCLEVSKQYSVNPKSVRDIRDNLKGWCEAKGKTYKNYKSALQNWIRMELKRGNIQKIIVTTPKQIEIAPAENKKVSEMMTKFKENNFKMPGDTV